MYYLTSIFNDGEVETLVMDRYDIKLIVLYKNCFGKSKINLIFSGEVVEYDNMNFYRVDELLERFEFLKTSNYLDDYEELKEYIINNYIKEENSYDKQ